MSTKTDCAVFRTVTCTECGEAGRYRGGTSPLPDGARVAGWRGGPNGRGDLVAYCPACAGRQPDYWDEMYDDAIVIPAPYTPTATR